MEIKTELSRTAMLIGGEAVERLARASVAVFGLGGVGGTLCEALARAGVGELTIIDGDRISLSNINRQVLALHSTVGELKTEVMARRIADINPDCRVISHSIFYCAENADEVQLAGLDYIADAIDSVTSKLLLIERARAAGVPIISAMGTGNKLDPSRLVLTDISKTDTCPLARVMRRELRARGITQLRVLFSREDPRTPDGRYCTDGASARRLPPGTMAPVPGTAGLMMAGDIIRHITGI